MRLMIARSLIWLALAAVAIPLACSQSGAIATHPVERSCDRLAPVWSWSMDPYGSVESARDVAVIAALFSQIPSVSDSDELFMMMVKEPVPGGEEALFVFAPRPRETPVERFRIVHARATTPVSVGGPRVPVQVTEAFLDGKSILELERIWAAVTGAARWPNRKEHLRNIERRLAKVVNPPFGDFTFDYQGDNVFSQGTVFSPPPGSCLSSFVQIAETLMRFADESSPRKRHELRQSLLQDIATLSKRLGIADESSCGGAQCLTTTLMSLDESPEPAAPGRAD